MVFATNVFGIVAVTETMLPLRSGSRRNQKPPQPVSPQEFELSHDHR
ncbi:hypothetical protein AB0L63_32285 [Nocardia sp. NPDC051990]